MRSPYKHPVLFIFAIFSVLLILPVSPLCAQGVFLRGAGAINESMGGAATAAPIDALGALQWNPASIAAFEKNELAFSVGMVLPTTEVSTSYSTSVDSEPGVIPAPVMGLVYRQPDSRWTYGLGIIGVGGAKTAYPNMAQLNPEGVNNPLLSNLKTLNSDIQIFQLSFTAAYQLTDKLSLGVAPTMTICQLLCDPLFIANAPEGTNPNYWSSGTSSRYSWGGGFQIGAYYDTKENWQYGFSYKSQQWMEPFRYKTIEIDAATGETVSGTRKLHLNLPDVFSIGLGYTGFESYTIALDLRYFSYQAAGDFTNLGWKNIFGLNLGVQKIVNDRLTVRVGYAFNENPIDAADSYKNVASPMITEHTLFLGASIKLMEQLELSMTYGHGFENRITGYIPYSGGATITNSLSADSLNLGVRVQF